MFRRVLVIVIFSLLITSCGGAAATPAPMTQAPATQPPLTESLGFPNVVDTATAAEPTQTATASPSQTPAATPTLAITLTPTDLPTLEIPTEVINAPAKMVWDGEPTYPADSTPGYYFRVTYDPDLWAVTQDQFGFPSLAHRNIPNCIISVTSGRGLPANVTTEHDVLYTDTVTFDVSTAYENGVKKFVTYTGGDKVIVTAFEVSFDEQSDSCIADAVTVLSTLRSVPVAQATPQP